MEWTAMKDIVYKKNFLKEVVIRVDFLSEITEIQKQLPKKITTTLKELFPIPETKETIKTEFIITKQKQELRKADEFIEWSFHSKDRMKTLTVQKSAIFIKISKYDTFEKVKREFMTGVNILFETFPQVQAKRLGLRYLNEIEFPEGDPLDWQKWLKKKAVFSLSGYPEKNYAIRSVHNVEFNYDTFNLRFSFGIENPDYPARIKKCQYTLDFDAYTNDILDKEEIDANLIIFHNKIQGIFESVITDDLRQVMK